MAGALGRHHEHVEIGARLDQLEMDVEAMGEGQRRALLHMLGEVLGIELRLQLVGRQHHDDVGPFRRLLGRHHLDAGGLRLLDGGRAFAQRDPHLLDAAVLQIEGMGMALAAIADDDDLLVLDQVHIGIAVVINAHGGFLSAKNERGCRIAKS